MIVLSVVSHTPDSYGQAEQKLRYAMTTLCASSGRKANILSQLTIIFRIAVRMFTPQHCSHANVPIIVAIWSERAKQKAISSALP